MKKAISTMLILTLAGCAGGLTEVEQEHVINDCQERWGDEVSVRLRHCYYSEAVQRGMLEEPHADTLVAFHMRAMRRAKRYEEGKITLYEYKAELEQDKQDTWLYLSPGAEHAIIYSR